MVKNPNVFEVEFFSEYVPYRTFDTKTNLFHNENTSGFILLGRPMVGAHLNDQDNLAEFFRRREWLKEGTSIQFLLVANPKCEHMLEWWSSHRRGDLYKNLAQKRVNHLNALSKESKAHMPLVRNYQLYISFTLPHKTKDFVEEEQLMEVREQLQEKLRTLGVPTQIATASDLIYGMGELLSLNEEPTTPFSWNKYEDINRQLCPPNQSFEITKDSVRLNSGYEFRALVPKNTPSRWSLVYMDKFLGESEREGMDFPFMLHYGLTICDGQGMERTKGIAKRESLENSLKSQLGKFIPQLKDQYEESIEVVEQIQRNEQLCYANLSVGIFSKSNNMSKAQSRLIAQMNRVGFEFLPTTFNHFPMLISMMPMTWTYGQEKKNLFSKKTYGYGKSLYELKRAKKTITREAQNMLPLLGEWTGQSSPGLPLVGRQGQLFFWNPYSSAFLPDATNIQTQGNYNVCIAGQSGSGKSVLLEEMANNVLSVGGKVFIFDYGRSFEKYCHLLGGQHITFDIGEPLSLNFFTDMPEGSGTADLKNRAECLNCIQTTVEVMASHSTLLGQLESSYIEQAVGHVAKEKGRKGDINDIREYLLAHKDKTAIDVGQMLYAYSKEGMYGGFFAGEAKLGLDSDLVVIETDDLRNHPSLMSVAVQMMIIRINQMMLTSNRRFPFMVIIDEAWQLLSGKGSADFIPNATRTARKYKGSIVLATQLLTDYFQDSSPAATAAFNTSNWKLIMNQNPDAIESWKHHPQLQEFVSSEGLMRHMKTIHTRTPHYAEFSIFNEGLKGVVGRLMLDPFSRILYSTNADEFRLVQEYKQRGLSLSESIQAVVDEQERGAHVA